MKYGIQLFTVRDKCTNASDMRKTLKSLSKMGYQGIEFFDYVNMPATELGDLVQSLGMEIIGTHLYYEKWFQALDSEIEYALNANFKSLIFPWIPPELRNSKMYDKLKTSLPVFVQKCGKAGIAVHYHNHDFDYAEINGKTVLVSLLSSDKDLLFEPDTFWIQYAGQNVEDELRKYKGRIQLVHIKDYTSIDPDIVNTTIGNGKMNMTSVLKVSADIGAQWLIVDQDNSEIDTLESAKISAHWLDAHL